MQPIVSVFAKNRSQFFMAILNICVKHKKCIYLKGCEIERFGSNFRSRRYESHLPVFSLLANRPEGIGIACHRQCLRCQQFFQPLLLRNYWGDFFQIWQSPFNNHFPPSLAAMLNVCVKCKNTFPSIFFFSENH